MRPLKTRNYANEVGHFQKACYGTARAKLFNERSGLDERTRDSTDWIGSAYFLNQPGYYDNLHAREPVKNFPYQENRDSGHGTSPDQGGYPSCKEWWSAGDNGLRSRLHEQIGTTTWQKFKGAVPLMGNQDAEDYAIRSLLSNEASSAAGNSSAATSGVGGGNSADRALGQAGGMIGALLGTVPAKGMQDAGVRAMPMMQYLVMMAIVIAMPLVIVFSGYSFKVIGTLTFAYFGATTLTFWFQLSHWLQNNLVDMVFCQTRLHVRHDLHV